MNFKEYYETQLLAEGIKEKILNLVLAGAVPLSFILPNAQAAEYKQLDTAALKQIVDTEVEREPIENIIQRLKKAEEYGKGMKNFNPTDWSKSKVDAHSQFRDKVRSIPKPSLDLTPQRYTFPDER